MRRIANIVGILLVIAVILIMIPRVYEGLRARERVEGAIRLADSVKDRINIFYAEHKRLPARHEADKFRVDGDANAQSVVYDADNKMIVVTTLEMGKRVSITPEEIGGALTWRCRTIDLDGSALPPACR